MSEPFDGRRLDPPEPTTMSAFLPVMILALVMVCWFAFQAIQLRNERDAIREAMTNQDKQIDESKKLRDSFYAIAHGAEVLADGGNANARLVVDGLKKRGITVTPNPPAAGTAPAAVPGK